MPKVINTVLVPLLTVLLCAVAFNGVSAAPPPKGMMLMPAHTQNIRKFEERNGNDRARIISVLEKGVGSHRLPEQAREKLATMHEGELRLVAALCDRIESANDGGGADLALLLAAALIVLS